MSQEIINKLWRMIWRCIYTIFQYIEQFVRWKIIYRLKQFAYHHARANWFFLLVFKFIERAKTDSDINRYKIISVNEMVKRCGGEQTILEEGKEEFVEEAEFVNLSEKQIFSVNRPPVYFYQICNCAVIGATNLIINSDFVASDVWAFDKEERIKVFVSSIKACSNKKMLLVTTKDKRHFEKAISMLGFAATNYYHFTIEIISRLCYINSQEEMKGIPILLDASIQKYQSLLDIVKKIVVQDNPLIFVEEGETVSIELLYFVSQTTWMPMNLKKGFEVTVEDFVMSQKALLNLRESVKKYILPNRNRKIFLSRKNLAVSRISNEQEIAGLFAQYGFEVVYTEELTYKEQVNLFSEASVVVGASGGALTNIVYCWPDTTIACIIPKEYKFLAYSTMGNLLGLNNKYLDAKVINRTAWTATDTWYVDKEYCLEFLSMYGDAQ